MGWSLDLEVAMAKAKASGDAVQPDLDAELRALLTIARLAQEFIERKMSHDKSGVEVRSAVARTIAERREDLVEGRSDVSNPLVLREIIVAAARDLGIG